MRHHLVVLKRAYLDLLLSGRKTVECRASSLPKAPYRAVSPGDMLWFKEPSGPVRALGRTGPCVYYQVNEGVSVPAIQREWGSRVAAGADFWRDLTPWTRFLSLITVESVLAIRGMRVVKPDRRAWVVLRRPPRPHARIV